MQEAICTSKLCHFVFDILTSLIVHLRVLEQKLYKGTKNNALSKISKDNSDKLIHL